VTKAQQEVKTVKAEMKKQQTRVSILEQTNKILLQEKDAFDQSKRKFSQEIEDLKNKVRLQSIVIRPYVVLTSLLVK
jgi:predicted RNase H-like nuclease (RuvC/YqgF family)